MSPEQIGMVIAERFTSGAYTGRDNLALHIASAIREAYEDAAKIAEEMCITATAAKPFAIREYEGDVAAAIRRLAQGETDR